MESSPSGRAAEDILVNPIKGIDMVSAASEWRGDQSWLFLEANTQ
jgi:hypothetical protein